MRKSLNTDLLLLVHCSYHASQTSVLSTLYELLQFVCSKETTAILFSSRITKIDINAKQRYNHDYVRALLALHDY